MVQFINANGRKIAYHKTGGKGPGVVFLGGFKSDMNGTKAVALERWAKAQGRHFLRLDYSGHGQSSGQFKDGCIGEWAEDAKAVIEAVCQGPQVLVGSSMGGWISLLLTRMIPEKIVGLVGIAAAPDFTENSMWAGFSPQQRAELEKTGHLVLPSDYGEPYIITKKLIEDGRKQLVLQTPLPLPFAVRLLQGTADHSVEIPVALGLLEHADSPDMRLTLIKGGDHSLSLPQNLILIEKTVAEVLAISNCA
ncbi:MAG TPA: alpha/beta hydrolase [Rhodobacteraceae bacterium]|jgi:pimeloyl-ACP methyl ester carboxylesterase|nr:alpha/beta hydrolase [Paracoccaceae bacterium]